jgi:secreted Zn-dependent insulinase-like peptidase
VPVTVKFSREFYDRFGHEAVDELVNHLNQVDQSYRGELRELNEHNFARFDAKLAQRVVQPEAKIDQRAAQLEAKIDQRVVQLEQRVTALDAKLDQRTAEIHKALESRIGQAEARLIRWTFAFWAPTMLGVVGLMIGVIVKL